MAKIWNSLHLSVREANLALILPSGQSFRWRKISDGSWMGVARHRGWQLCQEGDLLHYRILCGPSTTEKEAEKLLRDYFNLNGPSLNDLYAEWSKRITDFASVGLAHPGVRLLRQEPMETLFAFICSANNNITRISGMVERLCSEYGRKLGSSEGIDFYDFPTVELLTADGVETRLRQLGFGYRAKYIEKSARQIVEKGGQAWLNSLRDVPYQTAHGELLKLSGVGRKVADCVCLMALDKPDAVPIDTHVLQVSWRLHASLLKSVLPSKGLPKSLSDTTYQSVGNVLRDAWSPMPGWAQAVLFCADLPSSRSALDKSKGDVPSGSTAPASQKSDVKSKRTFPNDSIKRQPTKKIKR